VQVLVTSTGQVRLKRATTAGDGMASLMLDDLVADRCATIASLAPMTLRAARAALAGQPDAAALADACFHSADLVEGITAFEESRQPSFGDR
ncbi:uncharacterized protein METZ01_LOCUS336658, partial [marine metagenome]